MSFGLLPTLITYLRIFLILVLTYLSSNQHLFLSCLLSIIRFSWPIADIAYLPTLPILVFTHPSTNQQNSYGILLSISINQCPLTYCKHCLPTYPLILVITRPSASSSYCSPVYPLPIISLSWPIAENSYIPIFLFLVITHSSANQLLVFYVYSHYTELPGLFLTLLTYLYSSTWCAGPSLC